MSIISTDKFDRFIHENEQYFRNKLKEFNHGFDWLYQTLVLDILAHFGESLRRIQSDFIVSHFNEINN